MRRAPIEVRTAWRVFLVSVGAAVFSLPACETAQSQVYTPYSTFEAMTQQELTTLQVKLTWLGGQLAPVATLPFTTPSNTVDVALFTPFQRPGFGYHNDFSYHRYADIVYPNGVPFSATVQELEALIDKVGTLPAVTDGNVDEGGWLSFALLNTINNSTMAFEAIVDETNGRELFGQMLDALSDNRAATRALLSMACHLHMLSTTLPTDVIAQVSVALSGVRLHRTTGLFVGRVRVTNTSESTLAAPLTLIPNERGPLYSGNVRLVEEDGTTCRLYPQGARYINLPVGPGGLAPGASVEIIVKFENANLEEIKIAPRVFSGPGSR